jgi:hypothetical protein
MLAPRHALLAASAALVVVSLGSVVDAAVITLQPSSQDAYIQQNKPNRITGAGPSHTRVRVQGSPPGTQVWRGLMQFDLATIPTGAIVNSATMELYQGSVANSPPPLSHGLYRINASWLQSAVKWNNQPAHNAVASAITNVIGGQGPRTFDVSGDVQSFVNVCTVDHGWMIKSTTETGAGVNNDDVNYVAKEENAIPDQPKRPKLTVDFTPPPCTVDADCADASECTINERCVMGACVVDPLDCDDDDPCTDDICDCTIGCINAPICNDGFSCTLDTCDPETLECTNTAMDSLCTTDCSIGTCVADPDSTVVDPVTGCVTTGTQPDGTACTDEGNVCTDDECLAGVCSHPAKPDGTSCVDTDLCTDGDECSGGICGGSTVTCTPLSQCHDAGICNPMTGICSNPPKLLGSGCDDANACTATDTCDGGGMCVGSGSTPCTPLSQCHDAGVCDPMSGMCSNPPKTMGAGCDDGSLCTQTDECDGAGACVGSNDVVCTPLDDCHVAGTCNPGTGMCSNPNAGDGTPCDDGNTCTIEDECTAGSCGGNSMTCGDGTVQSGCNEECEDPGDTDPNCTADCQFLCGPTPEPGCRQPVLGGKAFFKLNDKTPDKRDKLLWKWIKGAATTIGEFGTPETDDDYTLCIWDESANPQPLIFASIPPDGTCGTKPCWNATAKRKKYKDKLLDPDGIQFTLLKPGIDTKAKIIVKGKGEPLVMPALPLTPTVTVQLHSEDGICWGASYSNPKLNVTEQFKSRAD